nr:immunoglobulin light chain junction region [Macaca mulatta]MOX29103.1 immunoglobulin light chain junction region [Macaca mulatta]MOX29209.1 immunoglobulin light chain junction region [Macaca mulatta]MOX30192.1 immunoglobulin light chain junction region [Macaca mulatta]MOX31637.1 immunoglobulin light chain junction region [Macaca mulatta]
DYYCAIGHLSGNYIF